MTSYEILQRRAKKLGLTLWTTGGYYRLSGFIRGKQRQGIFSSLCDAEWQIRYEENPTKVRLAVQGLGR